MACSCLVILIVMLRLINDRLLMGRFVNGRVFNVIAWGIVLILIASAILFVTTVAPGVFA